MDWLIIAAIKSGFVIVILLTGFAYGTLLERKLLGRLQVRYGPNRVGPFGLLQPVADGLKLLGKEDTAPAGADRVVFTLAPMISTACALSAFAVIPIGGTIDLLGRRIDLVVADVNIGILYVLGVTSLGIYGIVLAGWSSNNKYALLGGVRSSAQMLSYELALGMSLIGVLLIAGTLQLPKIVEAQATVPFILLQPLGFIVFLIAATAEVNRSPFDLPEAENELVAGYHVEYSGMKFALFQMAEYVNLIVVSSLATTLFLGGWYGPFGLLPGPHWFFLKVFLLICFFVWLRATTPRLRYDQLMRFGWKVLLPLALANVLLTAVGVLVLQG
ncbi:MAG: NADH-quinone oxidoreductase subunit NuoH [Chloroflexi bacterium]|nr:NADH-quinone oxidoreductase subunit NuoH [Chloroflexota bacterium]